MIINFLIIIQGKQCIKDLRKQIEYSLDEIDRVLID